MLLCTLKFSPPVTPVINKLTVFCTAVSVSHTTNFLQGAENKTWAIGELQSQPHFL